MFSSWLQNSACPKYWIFCYCLRLLIYKRRTNLCKKGFWSNRGRSLGKLQQSSLILLKSIRFAAEMHLYYESPFQKKNEIPIWQIADKRSRRRGIKPFQMYLRTVCVKKMLQFSLCVDISRKSISVVIVQHRVYPNFLCKMDFFFSVVVQDRNGERRGKIFILCRHLTRI